MRVKITGETAIDSFNTSGLQPSAPDVTRRYECPLVFPRVFGARQCKRIIEAGLVQPTNRGEVSGGGGDVLDGLTRLAEVAWLKPDHDTQWIFEKLAGVVERANRVYEYDLLGFTEEAQFTCYRKPGSFYDWHQDGLEGDLAGRKLSLVVQLSDPAHYDGSDLELFSLSSDQDAAANRRGELRQRGAVIAFPAFEFHRVTTLTRGERFSLVCWVGGPPFR